MIEDTKEIHVNKSPMNIKSEKTKIVKGDLDDEVIIERAKTMPSKNVVNKEAKISKTQDNDMILNLAKKY